MAEDYSDPDDPCAEWEGAVHANLLHLSEWIMLNDPENMLWRNVTAETITFPAPADQIEGDLPYPCPGQFPLPPSLYKSFCAANPDSYLCLSVDDMLAKAITSAYPKIFNYQKLTNSGTATRKDLNNHPSKEIRDKLQEMINNLADPIQAALIAGGKGSLSVSSGYRSEEIDQVVSPKDAGSGQHPEGEALDLIPPPGMDAEELANFIVSQVPEAAIAGSNAIEFDQLIWYAPNAGGHIHISYKPSGARSWGSRFKFMHAYKQAGQTNYVSYKDIPLAGTVAGVGLDWAQYTEEWNTYAGIENDAVVADESETSGTPPEAKQGATGSEADAKEPVNDDPPTIPLTQEQRAASEASVRETAVVDGKEVVVAPDGTIPPPPEMDPGSVGIALDKIWDKSFDHVKQGFSNLIQNNILSVDMVMQALEEVPGGKTILGPILWEMAGNVTGASTKKCPRPPMFTPPLDDFFKTVDMTRREHENGAKGNWGSCGGKGTKLHMSITLPKFEGFPIGPFVDPVGLFVDNIKDTIEMMVFKILQTAFKNILKVSMNAACETIGDTAKVLASLGDENTQFMDAMRTAVCGVSANDEEVAKGINSVLGALGNWGANVGKYPAQPSDESVQEFFESIGNTLTSAEQKSLLDGNPTPDAMRYTSEIISTMENNELASFISSEEQVQKLFSGLGTVLDSKILDDFLGPQAPNMPVNPSLCQGPHLDRFDNLRANILTNKKGCTPEQASEIMAKNKEREQEHMSDIANFAAAMSEGEIPLPPLISPDPSCPEQGIMPSRDPQTAQTVSDMFGDVFTLVNTVFLSELVTRHGLLNMILADVRGAGYKKHEEFYKNYFGDSLASEMDLFELFGDSDDGGREQKFLGVSSKIAGVFPDTVGAYLKDSLEILKPTFKTTFTRQNYLIRAGDQQKRKSPDIQLIYEGWKDPKDKDAAYNFELNYAYFGLREDGSPSWNPEFSFQRKNSFGQGPEGALYYRGIRPMLSGTEDYIESLYVTPSVFDSLIEAGVVQKFSGPAAAGVSEPVHAGTTDVDTTLGAPAGTTGPEHSDFDEWESKQLPSLIRSPQATVFGKIVYDVWAPHIKGANIIADYCADHLFDYTNAAILNKLAIKISQNYRSFDFGFDASLSPVIHPIDDYETYGGDADNPPYWIEPPTYGGWLGLYESMVPPVDACDRQSIINFNAISEKVDKFNNKISDDPRLSQNPDCVLEPPYSRILEKEAAAAIEGSILAMTRLYIVENFIKGMPVFSLFEAKYPTVFDEVLFGYIAETMLADILDLGGGVFGRPDINKYTFYYTFLEQVVQNFMRKVELELVTPTEDEDIALQEIRRLLRPYRPPTGPIGIKRKKRRAFEKYMYITLPYAKIILRRYIREELEEISKIFKSALNPSIHDLSSLLFGSPNWMVGALTDDGPKNVPGLPIESGIPASSTGVASTNSDTTTAPDGGWGLEPDQLEDMYEFESSGFFDTENLETEVSTPGYEEGSGYFPFLLEKYIKIEVCDDLITDTMAGESAQSSCNLAQTPTFPVHPDIISPITIFNIDDWESWISDNTEALGNHPIQDGWKQWSYGLRISCILPTDFKNTIGEDEYDTLVNSITNRSAFNIKSLKVEGENFSNRLLFPLISTEIPVDMSQPISSMVMGQYDITCMVAQMLKDPKYNTLFNYCFALPSLLSLLTIYTIEGFVPSLGQEWGGKEYEDNGGKAGGAKPSQFRKWNRETFKKTKKALRGMFRANYHVRDMDFEDPEEFDNSERTRQEFRIKADLNFGIPWFKKRLLRPKPKSQCEAQKREEEGDPLK